MGWVVFLGRMGGREVIEIHLLHNKQNVEENLLHEDMTAEIHFN